MAKKQTKPESAGRSQARKRGSQGHATTVQDVMVSKVVTIEPSASLADAARSMREANVGMLPVVDAGRVTGVITDRDIVVRGIARAVDVSSTPVGDCLSSEVICARPDWTTERALKAMGDAQVGRLPVVDADERLLGVVTLSSMALRAPDKREALETAQDVSRRSERESAA
jgi:CBS domain-containing protein